VAAGTSVTAFWEPSLRSIGKRNLVLPKAFIDRSSYPPRDSKRPETLMDKPEAYSGMPDLAGFAQVAGRQCQFEPLMNYLKVTGLRLGYIINFKHPKLEWKRVVK